MTQRSIAVATVLLAAVVLGLVLFVGLPGLRRRTPVNVGPPPAAAAQAPQGRKIKAHLFYIADDGAHLTSVERDIAYGESAADQAREIISAQIAPVPAPIVSPVPTGTTLRAVFIAEGGNAYVDLSREVTAAHSGGTVGELLTVYAIVDALTVNLPAVTAVQVLVDGKEVDTLAGHVDLRRPLTRNLAWVQ
ncbi:MAG: GerMN domain-containing protein [Acidobacteria bacterium]|nr:GerMN domain-containing protein [Acidobacteriota bacterium]